MAGRARGRVIRVMCWYQVAPSTRALSYSSSGMAWVAARTSSAASGVICHTWTRAMSRIVSTWCEPMKSWYWPIRCDALEGGVEHAEGRVVDPGPDHALDHARQRPGQDHDGQQDAPAPERPLQEQGDPGAEGDSEHHAEQRVPAGVLDAVPYLRVLENGGEVAEAPRNGWAAVRGSEWKKASMTVEDRRVDGERADEDDERRHHGVGQGPVPPPPLALTPVGGGGARISCPRRAHPGGGLRARRRAGRHISHQSQPWRLDT